jgi:transcriptional regulator with XRE-family HTH domain
MTAMVECQQKEKDQFLKEYGLRIRALRCSLGYDSVPAFARFLELSPATLRAYERGERRQDFALLRFSLLLYDKTGVSLDWLIRSQPHKYPPFQRPQCVSDSRVVLFGG